MGFTRPFRSGVLATIVAPAVALSLVALVGVPASADPADPTPVSASALPTVQVNGVVWSQVVIGRTVYAGGSFSETQPSGAGAGQDVTPRSNLLAYDVDSGELVRSFAPSLNGQVLSLAASPDGSRLYAVGQFTSVNGQAHSRIVAIDPASGSVISDFAATVNSTAYAVAATSNAVYVGGAFTATGAMTRSRSVEFGLDGSVLPWAPAVNDNIVRAIAISPDRSKVLIAGSFTAVNGQWSPGKGMAATDALTGGFLPWSAGTVVHVGTTPTDGTSSSIYSLSTRGDIVYATGQATGVYFSEANLEGMVAMNWSDGSIKWIEDCHGDTYSSMPFDDAVYIAGHPHNCSTVNGFGEMDPGAQRALGFTQARTQTLKHNTVQGPGSYADWGGWPAPSLLNWYPSLNIGSYTGSNQAAWSVTAGAGYLLYGGEFTAVNGVRQTGLTRFRGYDDGAGGNNTPSPGQPTPTPTPTATPTPEPTDPVLAKPQRVGRPDAIALSTTSVGVKWTAPKRATSDRVSRYVVTAVKGSKTLRTVKVAASARRAVITGLKKHTSYRIVVRAQNTAGPSAASTADLVKTRTGGKALSATKVPGKVAKPAAKAAGTHTVKIEWNAAKVTGATPVRRYIVRLYRGAHLLKTVSVASAARSVLVKGLLSKTEYRVSILAVNWAGSGAESAKDSAKTR